MDMQQRPFMDVRFHLQLVWRWLIHRSRSWQSVVMVMDMVSGWDISSTHAVETSISPISCSIMRTMHLRLGRQVRRLRSVLSRRRLLQEIRLSHLIQSSLQNMQDVASRRMRSIRNSQIWKRRSKQPYNIKGFLSSMSDRHVRVIRGGSFLVGYIFVTKWTRVRLKLVTTF